MPLLASEVALTCAELNPDAPPQRSPAIAPPNTNQHAASHEKFPLFDLPAELRYIIYREAIISGTMGILQASRSIRQEASPLIHKEGILRIRIQAYGVIYSIQTPPANLQALTSIQNIEISVTIKPVWPRRVSGDLGVIDFFTDGAAVFERGTCYITFKKSILQRLEERPEWLLRTIKRLKGFKTIIVTAIASDCDRDMRGQAAVMRARNKPVYQMALEELEPVFGPGIWHDAATQEGRYLEFRPKQS